MSELKQPLSLVATLGLIMAVTSASPTAQAELVYGVTETTQSLVSFDSADPNNLLSGAAISGLAANERITGIDFRPATGELFAAGNFSNLYTIDVGTGAASLVGSFTNNNDSLNGSSFSFDFNPTIDRIRNVSNVDQNLVLNPNDGTSDAKTDTAYAVGDVNFGVDPNVVHSAYTNNFAGSTSTQLYGIDSGTDALVTQANNAGTLGTVGSIGLDVTTIGGFDISGTSGIAYLAVEGTGADAGFTMFWTIDLATGLGSASGTGGPTGNRVGGGETLTAISVIPEPTTALILVGSAGWFLRRCTRQAV